MSDGDVLLTFVPPNADTLGIVGTAAAVWTPADHGGGGVLVVTIPPGEACAGEFGITSYFVTLNLTRGMCTKRVKVEVEGMGGASNGSPVISVFGIEEVLRMEGGSGGATCSTAELTIPVGTNPIEVKTGCSQSDVSISVYGNIADTPTLEITITVTLV